MALNKEFFDSINIDVVKKKYYNAGKVEAVFQEIRTQAEALTAENERMKLQLSELDHARLEIGDAILSAQNIYNNTVSRAHAEAEQIIADANAKRRELLGNSLQQQEQTVQRVEKFYTLIKEQQLACIEAINTGWQNFLCGLLVDENDPPAVSNDTPEEEFLAEDEFCKDDIDTEALNAIPDEIKAKMDAIAKELFSIDEE